MKICCINYLSLRNLVLIKIPRTKAFPVLLLWICYCLQGDNARPSHLLPQTIECRVIPEDPRRPLQDTCDCKCHIWCKATELCKRNFVTVTNSKVTDLFCNLSLQERNILASVGNEEDSNKKVEHSRSARLKRNSEFVPPFRIEVSENPNEVAVLEPFEISARLVDKEGSIITSIENEAELSLLGLGKQAQSLRGTLRKKFNQGTSVFPDVTFLSVGSSYKISVSSPGLPEAQSWVSESIRVIERELTLRPSGRTLPISTRENDTLSPAAGVIFFDVLNNTVATRSYLQQFTWEAYIRLLYNDVYPGILLGTSSQIITDGKNEILFNDVVITGWGYSYFLLINVKARETAQFDLNCLIGPFDVDMLDTSELPLIESEEYRRVRIAFDGDFQIVQEDSRKFEVFFLSDFGRRYPNVRWRNVTVSEGSVIVDAVITGLTDDLEKTSQGLDKDIGSGKADIEYVQSATWKANKVAVPSRKLLEESGTAEGQVSDDNSGGLSVAWIVAIVINVVLIVAFIGAIIYCWMRRKKQQDSRSGSAVKHFDGNPESVVFNNKAENKKKSMEQKAALMKNGTNIFTVEDHNNHRHGDDERCTCNSPTCYCSTGDKRKSDSRLGRRVVDENEDDPPGYPTPSPQPTFPTPDPSPDPDDYWRPDSVKQEEEDDDIFLPGTVTEPERPREERYYVYIMTATDGSRELLGQLYLPLDCFLIDVRRAIDRERNMSNVIKRREYRFLDGSLDKILTYQESSLDLERVFPAQEIYIQFLQLPAPPKVPRLPAYVGPLGICSASDCTKAAKIKCLDCKNTGYCSKRCMTDDVKEHRRACYKPAWRL